jgi:hypothetical protein
MTGAPARPVVSHRLSPTSRRSLAVNSGVRAWGNREKWETAEEESSHTRQPASSTSTLCRTGGHGHGQGRELFRWVLVPLCRCRRGRAGSGSGIICGLLYSGQWNSGSGAANCGRSYRRPVAWRVAHGWTLHLLRHLRPPEPSLVHRLFMTE